MSFLNDGLSRGGNVIDGLTKGASEETFKRASGPREKALATVGVLGAKALIGKVFGDDRNQIPDQYVGNTDIEVQQADYWDTYKFANSKFFQETVISDSYKVAKNHPMLKSLFLVDFEFNTSLANDSRLSNTYPRSMSFLLKNMTMPKATIQTDRINSYNVSKILPTNITYEPITCTFGDVYTAYRDGSDEVSLLDLVQQYMSYYFNDYVRDGQDLHPGYASGRTEKQYIDNISIYFFWADGARKIRLRNPFIKDFAYDNLDNATDEQLTLTCQIEYEYIDMHELNMTYDDFISAAEHLLEDVSDGFKSNVLDNPYPNEEALKPGLSIADDQRSTNMDSTAAQTLMRLAEIEAISAGGGLLDSDNAIVRAASGSALGAGLGAVGSLGGAGIGAVTGGLL